MQGKNGPVLDPLEACRFEFQSRLSLRHLVQGRHGQLRILAAKLDEKNPTARPEGPDNGRHHLPGMRELVVGVHQEHGIDRGLRKPRVFDTPQNRFHVADPREGTALFDELQQVWLDVDGKHTTLRHLGTESKGVVATGCADIGHYPVRLDLHGFEHQIRPLLPGARAAIEPLSPFRRHDDADLPPHVEPTDSEFTGLCADVGTGLGFDGLRWSEDTAAHGKEKEREEQYPDPRNTGEAEARLRPSRNSLRSLSGSRHRLRPSWPHRL
jgi:hypothetical protein